jgi:hypothetical protein
MNKAPNKASTRAPDITIGKPINKTLNETVTFR